MATYIGSLVYGIKSDVMMTQPLQGCNSAFWVELIASFIIMFLVTALTSEPQSVSVSNNQGRIITYLCSLIGVMNI